VLAGSYWVGAGAYLPDGRIAFGGFDGFTLFDPLQIEEGPPPPTPLLTGLDLSNRPVALAGLDPSSPLRAPLHLTRQLQLPAAQARSLTLRFAAPELVAPERLRFAYKLEGFDRDWIESGPELRQATYTNLPPGPYRFLVRARNADGRWSEGMAELALELSPAWWQTLWARGLAGLLMLAALGGLAQLWLRSVRRQRQRLQQQIAERTADILKLGEIGRELTTTLDIDQAMDRVYQQVSARLDAHVFAIGIFDAAGQRIHEAYVREAGVREKGLDFDMSEIDRPAVWCVRERRELVTATQADLLNYVQVNLPPKQGDETESIVYLPLLLGDRVIGCLTVQSLHTHAYSEAQLEFLRVLASYSAIALANAQSYGRLDQLVAERTADILALGEIGRELTGTLDAQEAMNRVHRRVVGMLDAHVFSVGHYDAEAGVIYRDYAIEGGVRLPPIVYTLDEVHRPAVRCVREGRELIIRSSEEYSRQFQVVLPAKVGADTESIVYLPLLSEGRVQGFLSVQSLRPHAYSEAQLEFLRVLASYTAIALSNAQSYARLDQRVAERTRELSAALKELKETQHTLVEREKMASLGGLVAGIAHEVNTPIGIAVTAASHLDEAARRLVDDFAAGKLGRQRFEQFVQSLGEGCRLILGSLERARQLIASFKQVAVDQSSEQRRDIDLATTLDEILFSLQPSYRRGPYEVSCDCPQGIHMDTFPGALFQIISNFINNSLLHAFPDGRGGRMTVSARAEGDFVTLQYRDDGIGMAEAIAARAFEPFFTTKRGSGGSGLGLHLVYNLVTQLLGGTIQLQRPVEGGVEFVLRLPRRAP